MISLGGLRAWPPPWRYRCCKHNALPEAGEGVALIHEVMPLPCYFDRVILMVLEKPRPLSKPLIVTLATYIPVGRLPASNV